MFPSWHFIIKAICGGVIFICTVFSILLAAPVLEGRFFPVVSKFAVLSTLPINAKETSVFVQFTKLRDCEYVGMAWYRKDSAGVLERVGLRQIVPRGDIPSPTRPLGPQKAGPWNVAMAEKDVRSDSYVETTHRCTYLWTTRTMFYP